MYPNIFLDRFKKVQESSTIVGYSFIVIYEGDNFTFKMYKEKMQIFDGDRYHYEEKKGGYYVTIRDKKKRECVFYKPLDKLEDAKETLFSEMKKRKLKDLFH